MDEWEGKLGDEYTDRNFVNVEELDANYKTKYGVTRSELNTFFLWDIPSHITILEVGANIGLQLALLQKQFIAWKLIGIDKNPKARERAVVDHVHYGDALKIGYGNNTFDMVFTSGLLIHLPPNELPIAMREIIRCSKKYVWGFEYYAPECTEINYRGQKDLLWKNNYAKLYRKFGLKTVKEIRLRYLNEDKWDTMFLMEKPLS